MCFGFFFAFLWSRQLTQFGSVGEGEEGEEGGLMEDLVAMRLQFLDRCACLTPTCLSSSLSPCLSPFLPLSFFLFLCYSLPQRVSPYHMHLPHRAEAMLHLLLLLPLLLLLDYALSLSHISACGWQTGGGQCQLRKNQTDNWKAEKRPVKSAAKAGQAGLRLAGVREIERGGGLNTTWLATGTVALSLCLFLV